MKTIIKISNYCSITSYQIWIFEQRHDKTNKMRLHSAKTQISMGICPVWSEASLSAWRKLESLATHWRTHWAHSKESDQTGWMPKLIWVFAGRTLILLVLSCRGSFVIFRHAVEFSCRQMFVRHFWTALSAQWPTYRGKLLRRKCGKNARKLLTAISVVLPMVIPFSCHRMT